MTLAELAALLLQDMGVIGPTETPTSEDSDFVSDKLTRAQARLDQLDIAPWTITTVPDYAVDAFIQYTIPSCARAFGYPMENPSAAEDAALTQIKHLVADRRVHTPGTATYF